MPPAKPAQSSGFYASFTARLLKLKALLNLIISDLFRTIFAIILFLALVVIVFGVLFFYQDWFPTVSDYLQTIRTTAATTTAQ